MNEKIKAYIDKLNTIETSESLLEKVKQLDHHLQKTLIVDILKANDLKAFANIIVENSDKKIRLIASFSSPEDIALDWLIKSNGSLIDIHHNVVEELFEKSCISMEKEWMDCYNRLKVLLDQNRSGVRVSFLENLLGKEEILENPKLEAEIYLFIAKIKELKGELQLDSDLWEKINLKEKPWLVTPLLYIYNRLIHPLKESLEKLWEIDEILLANDEIILSKLNSVKSYVISYLRQNIFTSLNDAAEEEFARFISCQINLKSTWMKEVLEEVLDSPAMDDINEKLVKLAKRSYQFERKQAHAKRLQIIEKDIDLPE